MSGAQETADEMLQERQWPIVVELQHPVEFAGETVSSLEFRRGRMGDLKGMKLDERPPLDQLMLLGSRMCGKPLKVIELLSDVDGAEVIAIALVFWARSLSGGRTL